MTRRFKHTSRIQLIRELERLRRLPERPLQELLDLYRGQDRQTLINAIRKIEAAR